MFRIVATFWITFVTTLAIGDVGETYQAGVYSAWLPVGITLMNIVTMLLSIAAWEEIKEDA